MDFWRLGSCKYWAVTEIYGPDRTEVWRKSTNRGWILQVTKTKETVPPSLFNLPRNDINHTEIGVIFAKIEKINELDKILFEYIREYRIPYEEPYKYWLGPGETDLY
jgi:hypothetical protein